MFSQVNIFFFEFAKIKLKQINLKGRAPNLNHLILIVPHL